MNDLDKDIYEWFAENLDAQLYYATIPSDESFDAPVISFIRLPSLMEQISGTSNAQYQFSVRCRDLDEAERVKEEIIQLIHQKGRTLFSSGVWFFGSEVGTLVEDEGRIFHCPVILNLKYVR